MNKTGGGGRRWLPLGRVATGGAAQQLGEREKGRRAAENRREADRARGLVPAGSLSAAVLD